MCIGINILIWFIKPTLLCSTYTVFSVFLPSIFFFFQHDIRVVPFYVTCITTILLEFPKTKSGTLIIASSVVSYFQHGCHFSLLLIWFAIFNCNCCSPPTYPFIHSMLTTFPVDALTSTFLGAITWLFLYALGKNRCHCIGNVGAIVLRKCWDQSIW